MHTFTQSGACIIVHLFMPGEGTEKLRLTFHVTQVWLSKDRFESHTSSIRFIVHSSRNSERENSKT